MQFRGLWLLFFLFGSVGAYAQDATTPAESTPAASQPEQPPTRPVETSLELQVELHRHGFSCGSIDGVAGAQTAAALRGYQESVDIPITGLLDPQTKEHLHLSAPALLEYTVTSVDLASVHPVPASWLEKSLLTTLAYGSLLELVAERYHAHPGFVKKLNPSVDWSNILPGVKITVPAVEDVAVSGPAGRILISLANRILRVYDAGGVLIAQFPVSIARMVEKRPVGVLHVVVAIPDPDYTFDPELFPEAPESKTLGKKLIIPPGPNNPVGLAWIGLDRSGYGIHGTPEPENVGRTESHGCFRLANWDVLTLLDIVQVGIPVSVEP